MALGIPELLLILAIIVLVLGPKRLPALGRQLGGGLREFKDAITGRRGGADEELDDDAEPPAALPDRTDPRDVG